LADVQSDLAAKDAAEELRKQEELIQEKIRQEKLKAKQRQALEKPAKKWLAKLDPLSSEGLWFEKFAESYPDKLAAAIDYLQTNS
ncbi:salt stress protein, Slr1339 family, partial [Anabaena sp. UHCC 0253]